MLTALIMVLFAPTLLAQSITDSLQRWLATHPKADTGRVNRLIALAQAIRPDDYAESLLQAQEALTLARKLSYPVGEAKAMLALGVAYGDRNDYTMAVQTLTQARQQFGRLGDRVGAARVQGQLGWIDTQRGNYVPALTVGLHCLNLAKELGDSVLLRQTTVRLAMLYSLLGDYDQALRYYSTALDGLKQSGEEANISRVLNGMGELYRHQGDLRRAARYYNKAIRLAQRLDNAGLRAEAESNLAAVEVEEEMYEQALLTGHRALRVMLAKGGYEVIAWTQIVLSRAHLQIGRADSAIYYARQSWNLSRQIGYREATRDASNILAKAYAKTGNYRHAYEFNQVYQAYEDTLSGRQTRQQVSLLQQNAYAAERKAQAALRREESRRQQQWLITALISVVLLAALATILWRSYRRQQRANEQLREQQARLKATQNQLIQSEKMASLGELTAGIAHEIQNPLNFVNNFSEVSVELIDELTDEQLKPNRDADLEADLLADLKQNLQKITQHGSRASSIVRGMLQHSRASTGQREPTDLNALCEEYLRLAYHGLRAKDKTFNAHFTTDLDANLGLVTVVSQDLGRVLLNLFTNAFYAVHQKQKQIGLSVGAASYQPTVQVQTRYVTGDGQAQIKVIDNGTGMPEALKTKIFQPFFTTKPTGEGTGLGLSLAYDIITKGHLGTLDVQSREGEGTEFIIRLPA
ncbi:tetratricopeptide repeat protein [Spirosoma arcticum]